MFYAVRISTHAKADREGIAIHLSQYSVIAPRRFKQELRKYIDIISKTPLIFSRYESNPAYRHVVVYGSYVLFYTVSEADRVVSIYRILHGAQDIDGILLQS